MNRRQFLSSTVSAAALTACPWARGQESARQAAPQAGGISLNYDNSHFFCWHRREEMTAAGVDAWVDQFAGTQVDEIFFCPNSQRSSVASTTRQTVWDGYDPDGPDDQPFLAGIPENARWARLPSERQHFRNWAHAAWLLHSRGIDPYARWLARCRMHGIRAWLSMRMNDVHYVENPRHSIHDAFWKQHPEFRRDPVHDPYNGHCLDYGHPEVRAYQLAYVREMVFRYDLDGFELDWLRNPYYFKPGAEREGREVLTAFIADVRRMLDERAAQLGHPVSLSVRVPDQPEVALALGFDVESWVERGLIDRLVVSPFLFSQFDIPMERWRQMLNGAPVILEAGLMISIRPTFGGNYSTGAEPTKGLSISHSVETARGAAAGLLGRGADRVYLFNFFDCLPYGNTGPAYRQSVEGRAFQVALHEIGSMQTVRNKSRRHLLTNADIALEGFSLAPALPAEVSAGGLIRRVVITGPRPRGGQIATVGLAVEENGSFDPAAWVVRVNGETCAPLGSVKPPPDSRAPTHASAVPAGTLRSGANLVELHNRSERAARLVWLEVGISAPEGRWAADEVEVAQFDSEFN